MAAPPSGAGQGADGQAMRAPAPQVPPAAVRHRAQLARDRAPEPVPAHAAGRHEAALPGAPTPRLSSHAASLLAVLALTFLGWDPWCCLWSTEYPQMQLFPAYELVTMYLHGLTGWHGLIAVFSEAGALSAGGGDASTAAQGQQEGGNAWQTGRGPAVCAGGDPLRHPVRGVPGPAARGRRAAQVGLSLGSLKLLS